MAVTNQSITIYRGEAATLSFTMSPVVNITGWTLRFTAVAKIGDAAKVLDIVPVITSGPNGTFTVSLTATQTDPLTRATHHFDVWRTDAGSEEVLALGQLVVEETPRNP